MRLWGKSTIWSTDDRKFARRLVRDADYLALKIGEGTRYLLVANGAALVAIISGIGGAWSNLELRAAFKVLIIGFVMGFGLCILLWLFALVATQQLLAFKAEFDHAGFTPRTWSAWRRYQAFALIWAFLLAADATTIFVTGLSAASRFGLGLRDWF